MKRWRCVEKTTHDNQLIVPGEIVVTGDDVVLGKHVFELIESKPDKPADPLAAKTVTELKALADEMELRYDKNIKKDDLIKLINEGRKIPEGNPLDALEIEQLKALAKEKGIEFEEDIEKDELIELISRSEETGNTEEKS